MTQPFKRDEDGKLARIQFKQRGLVIHFDVKENVRKTILLGYCETEKGPYAPGCYFPFT